MSVTWQVDSHGSLCVSGEGSYAFEEYLQVLATALEPRPPAIPVPLLLDLMTSRAFPSNDELACLALLLAEQLPQGSRVALAAGEPLQYGLARMVSAYCAGHGLETAVFEDRPTGERWLQEESE